MAEDDQATPDRAAERAARRGSQSNPADVPDEVRYSIDELKENPSLLGVSRHAIAGAFHDSDRKTFTLAAATKIVNSFIGRAPETDAEDDR